MRSGLFAPLDPARLASRLGMTRPQVIHLSVVRARTRLEAYQEAIAGVLASNRRTIGRLHASGALFSRQGARAGRDLLLAHQHLLRVVALLQRLTGRARAGQPRAVASTGRAYRELERLLERTSSLTERTGSYLGRIASR
jgi:hypothetical protein